jgi:hypothetical protein
MPQALPAGIRLNLGRTPASRGDRPSPRPACASDRSALSHLADLPITLRLGARKPSGPQQAAPCRVGHHALDSPLYPLQATFTAPGDRPAPELLLLDCLHADPTRPDTAWLSWLQHTDWLHLVTLAQRCNVSFQLFQRLTQPRFRALVPSEVVGSLRASVQIQTARFLLLQKALVAVLKACNAANLQVLVLKGMSLAHTVYETPIAREMVDIDLLFRPVDLPLATSVLKSVGYAIPHDADNLMDLAPSNKEYALRHPLHGITLDVHWSLTEPPMEAAIDESGLWQRAQRFEIAGHPALGLAPEDLLAHVCFHASHHHYFDVVGLRPFLDIARISADTSELDWEGFRQRVTDWGWSRGCTLTLSIARRYLGAPVPASVLESAATPSAELADIQRAALEAVFLRDHPADQINLNILRVWAARSWRDRLRLFVDRLFPPQGQLIQEFGLTAHGKLPPTPILHLRRFGRLLGRHGPKLWGLRTATVDRRAHVASQRQLIAWLDAKDFLRADCP